MLGEGGFGRTYEAIDTDRMDDSCVIKQFFPQLQETSALKKATELFKQEAKRLYDLGEHPQIPRLIAYFEQDKRLYLVQEFIEGQTLLQELQQQVTFSEEKIKQLLFELLPILKFVHERGVIHRDIKPENIMRRRQDGKLMLIDFGVSKQATGTVLGKVGTTVGTPGYAPMEQMRGQVYPASDLYSLGITCIRLMTGCLLKEDGTDDIYDGLNGCWIWRKRLPSGVNTSYELGEVLDKLIQDYVKERYQSADEVMQALYFGNSKYCNSNTTIATTGINFSPAHLISAVGIDYNKLKSLLANGKLRESDEETAAILLKIANRETEGWLTVENIQELPFEDLNTINKLWINHSNGTFSFSTQKRIWQEVKYNLYKFGKKVGWCNSSNIFGLYSWKSYYSLNFTLNAPMGHLPARSVVVGRQWEVDGGLWVLRYLFERLEDAGI